MSVTIDLTKIEIIDSRIPSGFSGSKIIFLSDSHQKEFGIHNSQLIMLIKNEHPDYIFVTGDILDDALEKPLRLMGQLVAIAPVYYVPGNHEYYSGVYSNLKEKLIEMGVVVFRNNHLFIEKGHEKINIVGVEDPVFKGNVSEGEHHKSSIKKLLHMKTVAFDEKVSLRPELEAAMAGVDHKYYTILLSHRPEQMPLYSQYPIDLVFSGHAHGGQIRLPKIGGVLSSSQGLFPKYQSGVYEENNTKMIVSRGLGNGHLAFRINDNSEVICVVLRKEEGIKDEA